MGKGTIVGMVASGCFILCLRGVVEPCSHASDWNQMTDMVMERVFLAITHGEGHHCRNGCFRLFRPVFERGSGAL